MVAVRLELGGAQHDEQRVAVLLELWSLVGAERVLDREIVQAECLLEGAQERLVGLLDADPHEPVRLAEDSADLLDRDVPHLAAVGVDGGVDHAPHGLPLR